MKKLFYTTLAVVAGLMLASCTQEHMEVIYDPAQVTVQTLGEITGVTLDAEGEAITATFNPVDFKMAVAVNYTLYASASADMSDKVKVASSISVDENNVGHITINQKDMNSLVYSLGGVADEAFTLYFQLSASMANDKKGDIGATTNVSNIVSATFTPYSTVVKDVDLFPHVWVIGASSNVGSWSFDKVYQFLYDYEKTGNVYSGLIDFGEDGPAGGFKLVGVPNWDDPDKNWGSEAQEEDAEAGTIQLVAGGGSKDIKCYSKRFYFFSYDTNTLVLTKGFSFDNIGIVGAFNGWNAADENMKMQYNSHLHRFYIDMTFSEATELKFTCDDAWDTNWGGENGATAPGGANIAVEAGSYRIYFDPNKTEYDLNTSMFGKDEPTGEDNPGGDTPQQYEGWGVVGTINSWNAPDVHMSVMGDFWVAKNVELTPDDQFKFRKDEDWGNNIGAAGEVEPFVVEVGIKYEGVAGGKNLGVAEAGKYDLYVNPEALTFYVMAPGEIPGEIGTWGVVGTINSWGGSADLAMTEENGMLVRKDVALTASDQFKIRYASDWTENRGGAGTVEPFIVGTDAIQAVPNGKNLGVAEDGTYDVWYNPLDEVLFVLPAGTKPEAWGVVGSLTGWGGDRADYMMFKEGDFYVYKGIALATDHQFKIRYASDWVVNRGADGSVEPFKVDANTVLDAVQDGKNLGVNADGNYDIYYNPTDEKLYIMAEGEAPEGAGQPTPPEPTEPDTWGVVGSMTGWADGADVVMTKDGDWFFATGVALAADDQFKLRGDGAWTFNLGADGEVEPYVMTVGEALPVVAGGKNLAAPAAGSYDIYLDNANKQVYLMAEGEQPGDFHVFADYIYAIGGDTGWSDVYPLRSGVEKDANNGKYKGFGYLSQEFKFKPNADNWEGDWEYDAEGKIADNGGSNCPAPETAGYYMIEVDLNEMTYKLTLITTIGIIGPAQAGGWDADTDLTYNPETKAWEATGVVLTAGDMKFRANDAWDINWGGALHELVQGGDNIAVEAGTYDVKLFAWCDGLANALLTPSGDTPTTKVLFLNEFDCKNKKIEIYNASDAEIDMTGWKLLKDEKSWVIPAAHAKVPAKGFIVYTCKSDGTTDPEFGLSGTKGFIVTLQDAEGKEIDKVDNLKETDVARVEIPDGKSWGRKTDGADEFVIFDTPSIGAPNGAVNAGIKIDGDMSDWASIEGVSNGQYGSFKATSDDDYIYLYSWRTTEGRYSQIWNDDPDVAGYIYIGFNLDGDESTGVELWGNGNYEFIGVIWPYLGTSENPSIAENPGSACAPDTYTLENVYCKGVISDKGAEIEYRIPRADLPAIPTTAITITSWGNKDLSKVTLTCTL